MHNMHITRVCIIIFFLILFFLYLVILSIVCEGSLSLYPSLSSPPAPLPSPSRGWVGGGSLPPQAGGMEGYSSDSTANKRKRLSLPGGGQGGAAEAEAEAEAEASTGATGAAAGGDDCDCSDRGDYYDDCDRGDRCDHDESSYHSRGSHQSHHSLSHPGGGGGLRPGLGLGLGLSSSDLAGLKRDREREGRCAECGAQTHEVRTDPMTGIRSKEPLTVQDEVRRGRCLLCYPLPATARFVLAAQQQLQQAASASGSASGSYASYRSGHSSLGSRSSLGSHGSGGSSGATGGHGLGRGSHHPYPHSRSMGHVHAGHMGGGGGIVTGNGPENAARRHSHSAAIWRPPSRLSDHPDSLEGTSVTSATSASLASATSAAQLAAEQVGIEDALSRIEAESADLCDVLASMRRFPRSTAVQEMGCEKVWIRSWDDGNSAAVGRVGGISTVVAAMRGHPDAAHLQQCGCEALQNLALDAYNRGVIAEQGGIDAVLDAMARHGEIAGVQQGGCKALANISGGGGGGEENGSEYHENQNRVAVAECGGLHAILRAVRAFPEDEEVLRGAYQALRSLGYNPTAELERAQQEEETQRGVGVADAADGEPRPDDVWSADGRGAEATRYEYA